MKKNNTIVVGVDYSIPSKNALKEAARQANALDCRLVCVHILDKSVVDFWHGEGYDNKSIVDNALIGVEEMVRSSIGSAHDLRVAVFLGNPVQELLNVIEEEKPQLVILGANGYDGTNINTIGPVATKVVRKSQCNVMLIKREHDMPFNSIMVCVDFSDSSVEAAHDACKIAGIDKAEVHLVHVYLNNPFGLGQLGSFQLPETSEQEIIDAQQAKLDELSNQLAATYPDITISSLLKSDLSVSHGLLTEIESSNVDLVMIGAYGKYRFKDILIGTTAERLLNNSSSSICAVKIHED